MPATYEPIATTTLGSAASTITFSSIGSGYTDLRLIVVGSISATVDVYMRVNGDSSSLYSETLLYGDGSAASSYRLTGATRWELRAGWTATQPLFFDINLFNYAGSTNKTALIAYSNDRNGAGEVNRQVNLYRSTSAITSLSIFPNGANWNTGATATLYGILKA
jgi:hypothetical protein